MVDGLRGPFTILELLLDVSNLRFTMCVRISNHLRQVHPSKRKV